MAAREGGPNAYNVSSWSFTVARNQVTFLMCYQQPTEAFRFWRFRRAGSGAGAHSCSNKLLCQSAEVAFSRAGPAGPLGTLRLLPTHRLHSVWLPAYQTVRVSPPLLPWGNWMQIAMPATLPAGGKIIPQEGASAGVVCHLIICARHITRLWQSKRREFAQILPRCAMLSK